MGRRVASEPVKIALRKRHSLKIKEEKRQRKAEKIREKKQGHICRGFSYEEKN